MKQVRPHTWLFVVGLSGLLALEGAACEDRNQAYVFGVGGGHATASGAGGSTSTNPGGQGGDVVLVGTGGDAANGCVGLPDQDNDGDGYTEIQGDCHDCDPNINPGAVEAMTEPGAMGIPADENCNGVVDEPPPTCDENLVLDSEDPIDAAKALGLCEFIKSAQWVLAEGKPIPTDPAQRAAFHLGHGILSKFGTNNVPLEGARMLLLSSGTARNKEDPAFVDRSFDKQYISNAPMGFPLKSPLCPAVNSGMPHDATGVEFEINVPKNANAASFDFQFFSYAWPDNVCTEFNDMFVALLQPTPKGQLNGNVAFDLVQNPVGINFGGFNACGCPGNPPGECAAGGHGFSCSLGTTWLAGTPFEADVTHPGWTHASTGWIRSMMPVDPGSTIRIRFVTYDSGDGNLDSSTLVDHWQWYANFATIPELPWP